MGREAELQALQRAFDQAAAGSCRLVLLEGEAGIGKTRLAATFARECQRRGAVTLYGRCDSQTVVPYQPFIEALRRYLADAPVEPLRERIPAHLTELGRVLPELADGRIPASRPSDPDEETERYWLFEAVSALLCVVSRPQPGLLILDDLHWADQPTLIMLRQVIRSVGDAPMLIIGTYRETERTETLLDTLADLRREHIFDRVTLHGLEHDDAATLIEELSDRQTPAALSRAMWEESCGNPFFLEEMLRHRSVGVEVPPAAVAAGSVPDAIKDVIGRRLARLSDDGRRILEIACVAGNEFSISVLEQLSGVSEDVLDEALREAIDAHLITEVNGAYGRFAFEHSLTRQSLLEELTLTRRSRLHLRIGEALEQLDEPADGKQLAELAHHFLHAPPERGLAKALDYAVRAARHALDVLAYEEAVRHYELALSTLERLGGNAQRRHQLLLALGESHVKAGNTRRSRALFREAAEIARGLGSSEGLANAALGLGGGQMSGGVVDEKLMALLAEALEAIGDKDGVLRARLLSRWAIELSFSDQHERRATVSEEAVAVARETGDAGALSAALLARHWSVWRPENLDERLALATELLTLASAAGIRRIEMQGLAGA